MIFVVLVTYFNDWAENLFLKDDNFLRLMLNTGVHMFIRITLKVNKHVDETEKISVNWKHQILYIFWLDIF